ncbi:MAG: M1 family aminopeptidase, partial [Promethearchaeota archaeon]
GEPLAPFDLTIEYPVGNHSCVPGLLESTKKTVKSVIDHYKSKNPNIPAFSVAPYQKFSKAENGFGVEFFIYPGQSLDEELFDHLFNIVQLFYKTFGDNGTNTYKFGTVGAYDSTTGGGENKGNAIYFDAKLLNEYDPSFESRTSLVAFYAHEIFHNWNLFFVHLVGRLYEWFGEGGANFIAAWALEKIVNENAGTFIRRRYVSNYIENKGFNAKRPLLNVDKIGGVKENLALMYYYGALVWEQLRQKIGERALFTGLGRFFRQYGNRNATYKELLECLQKETLIDIKGYLEPWINQIPKIDISITRVNSKEIKSNFITEIKIQIQSERDYEIFLEVGYKTAPDSQLCVKGVIFTKKGTQTISLESGKKPTFIQVDPFYRVPQMDLENCSWHS